MSFFINENEEMRHYSVTLKGALLIYTVFATNSEAIF